MLSKQAVRLMQEIDDGVRISTDHIQRKMDEATAIIRAELAAANEKIADWENAANRKDGDG
jgi:hypothetical protein